MTTASTLPHASAPRALAEELRTLATLTPTELRHRYAEVFGEASRSGNRQWLLRRIAWRLQALAEGGYAGYVGQEFIPRGDKARALADAVRRCDV